MRQAGQEETEQTDNVCASLSSLKWTGFFHTSHTWIQVRCPYWAATWTAVFPFWSTSSREMACSCMNWSNHSKTFSCRETPSHSQTVEAGVVGWAKFMTRWLSPVRSEQRSGSDWDILWCSWALQWPLSHSPSISHIPDDRSVRYTYTQALNKFT